MIDAGEHLGLVYSVVNKMRWASADFDELVGVGTVALVRAARDFDKTRGFAFSTFATTYIERAMLQRWNYERCKKRSARRTVGMTDGVVRWMGERDAPGRMDREDARRDAADRVAGALALLDDRERELILARVNGATLDECGAMIGLTREAARRVEIQGMRRMREHFGVTDRRTLAQCLGNAGARRGGETQRTRRARRRTERAG